MTNGDEQQNDKHYLETCVQKYKIFIDTCSLLDPNAEKFWAEMMPLLNGTRSI